MSPANYDKIYKEWIVTGGYRKQLVINPNESLKEWAQVNNVDSSRLSQKNTEVRKIEGVEAQVKYCDTKAAEAKLKVSNVIVEQRVVKHAAECKCKACKVPEKVEPIQVSPEQSSQIEDFNDVINSIINIQKKMASDLKIARAKIIELESVNQQLRTSKDILYATERNRIALEMMSLKQEIVQLKTLQKVEVVESSSTTIEMNCKCGLNTPFDSDLIDDTVHCIGCSIELCEDCHYNKEAYTVAEAMCMECFDVAVDSDSLD